jgi:hypothetical protein
MLDAEDDVGAAVHLRPLMLDAEDDVGAAVHLRPRSPMADLAEAEVR